MKKIKGPHPPAPDTPTVGRARSDRRKGQRDRRPDGENIPGSPKWVAAANVLIWAHFGDQIVACETCGKPKIAGYAHCLTVRLGREREVK